MGLWVAALDGGGTKTAAALADRIGSVRLLPEGAGSNPQDGPGWQDVLREALGRILEAPGGVMAMVLGLPGLGEVPAHDAAVLGFLDHVVPVPFEPLNDVFLAHLGALAGAPGVLVLAGTGSMAVARGPEGLARVGGWGDVLGDEGSAAWIGREALALATRALDGRAPAVLPFARELCARLGPEARGDFAPLAWLMAQPGTPRAAVASVARHIDALARDGHGEAMRLLRAAAAELALAARTAAARAGLRDAFPWSFAGGVLRSEFLRYEVAGLLGRPPEPPRLSPLGGGLLRAAELAGWTVDGGWAARVEAQLQGAG